MVSLIFFSLVFGFQDIQLEDLGSWQSRAEIWMTAEEKALYKTLDSRQIEQFKGYFIARRQDQPEAWAETGLEYPLFYIPKTHGDIRDALIHILGKPRDILQGPYQRNQPRAWIYADHQFEFKPGSKGQVLLTGKGEAAWERVKKSLIKNPELRYDFRRLTIGRNRLPAEILWDESQIAGAWRLPDEKSNHWRISIAIPKAFMQPFENTPLSKKQTMEMLVFLKASEDQPREMVDAHRIRHDSRRVDLSQTGILTFETTLPPGRFQAEILVYSGFLPRGIRVVTPVTSLPIELPRIGDPIICDQWQTAGIRKLDTDHILAGGSYYRAATEPFSQPGRVLVRTRFAETRLQLFKPGGVSQDLKRLHHKGQWAVFECPPLGLKDRLLASASPKNAPWVAFSQSKPASGTARVKGPTLNAKYPNDYLRMEELSFDASQGLQLLSINGEPLVGSTQGKFPWPPFDWGRQAELRLEFQEKDQWTFANYQLRRNQVFQEIRVRPRYLVAGTRNIEGKVSQVPVRIEVEGMEIPPEKLTAFKALPKLWGIVVSDALLKSPAWHEIKSSVTRWFRKNTATTDQIYVVHIATRPQLVLEPTHDKALVQATLESLQSAVQLENYFTVRYLFDGLTQLPQHQTMPHQVLLMTHQLTEEVSQMETLLPILRESGLQLYNLEFPFEFLPESEERIANTEVDPLLEMKVREQEDQWRMGPLRDNIQEDRNVLSGWSIFFKTRRQKRDAKEDAIRLEAFQRAFNQQLASLTAGLTLAEGPGQSKQSLFLFLEALQNWQENLVHVQLPLPLVTPDMIKVKPEDGHVASWTLVEWRPED